MKPFFLLFTVLFSAELHAQKTRPNTVFMQIGLGKVPETGPPSIFNVSLNYDRVFFSEKHWRIGGQIGFGYWTNGSIYDDLNISGQQVLMVATVKYGIGAQTGHYFGIDGGYAFFNTGSIGEIADRVERRYHLPTVAVSYQYHAAKAFYGRTGVSTSQGLFVGFGRRF